MTTTYHGKKSNLKPGVLLGYTTPNIEHTRHWVANLGVLDGKEDLPHGQEIYLSPLLRILLVTRPEGARVEHEFSGITHIAIDDHDCDWHPSCRLYIGEKEVTRFLKDHPKRRFNGKEITDLIEKLMQRKKVLEVKRA